MIRLYIKVPQEFVSVIFSDRCCVVHIPCVGMVKFKFLAHFPVDHLAHPVIIIIIIIIIISPLMSSSPALACCILLESE